MNKIKWIVLGLIVLLLLGVTAPDSGPVHVDYASAYSNQRYAEWKFDDPIWGGGFFRVKGAVTWTTSDPHAACYDWRYGTGIEGVDQHTAITYPPYKCVNPFAHEYPLTPTGMSCWVPNAFIYQVQIDYCGVVGNPYSSPPYFWTVAVKFRVCGGIYKTPFSMCTGLRSEAHLSGSSVWVRYRND